MSDEFLDKEFRDILWRSMIAIIRAFAKRYGYGRIEIIKEHEQ